MNDDPVDVSAKLVSVHYHLTGREYLGGLRHGGGTKTGYRRADGRRAR